MDAAFLLAFLIGIIAAALAHAIDSRASRRHVPPPGKVATRPPPPYSGRAWVIDGDTIVVRGRHVRLFGIDAPEMDQAYGTAAKWALVALCKGQVVTVRPTGDLSYDRDVATCHLPDGTDLCAEMVRQGHALDWPMFSDGRYRALEPPGARARLFGRHAGGWRDRPTPSGAAHDSVIRRGSPRSRSGTSSG